MTIFITGASGFIGGAIAQHLISQGHTLHAMARSEGSQEKIKQLGAHPVQCDLKSISPDHLSGAKCVIHCAAFVEPWGTKEQFWQANVEGTQRMLDAAKRAGVKRFIHIGTEAALFYGQDMHHVDETEPYALDSPFYYSSTKAEAEKRVLEADSPSDHFATLSLRPRLVWGPGDQTIAPELKKMVEAGQFMWIDQGQANTSTTYITNLTHASELALTKGEGGQAYFISDDEIVSFKSFLTQLTSAMGITLPSKNISGPLARGLAIVVEGFWRLLGLSSVPPLTRLAANLMSRECTLNIAKAKKELSYQPQISIKEGMLLFEKSMNNLANN